MGGSRSSAELIPYDSARLIRGDSQDFAVASPRRTWMSIGSSGSLSFEEKKGVKSPFALLCF